MLSKEDEVSEVDIWRIGSVGLWMISDCFRKAEMGLELSMVWISTIVFCLLS